MLKSYTITQEGKSNGNAITQPFTIEVLKMNYYGVDNMGVEQLEIHSCTKNGFGIVCHNDDIEAVVVVPLPAMTSSKNSDLSEFESLLQEKYPDNWS
jgi:hypothetical protein